MYVNELDEYEDKVKRGSFVMIEIQKYQKSVEERNTNSLMWWRNRKAVYPTLYRVVKKSLFISATKVESEMKFPDLRTK